MKGIDDLIQPVIGTNQNCYGQVAFPTFNHKGMQKKSSLMATIRQYPTELLSLFGGIQISDREGKGIMKCIHNNNAHAGSDGSVKDGKGGHAFCITDNSFTKTIWGFASTVGS